VLSQAASRLRRHPSLLALFSCSSNVVYLEEPVEYLGDELGVQRDFLFNQVVMTGWEVFIICLVLRDDSGGPRDGDESNGNGCRDCHTPLLAVQVLSSGDQLEREWKPEVAVLVRLVLAVGLRQPTKRRSAELASCVG
jgi:hypothetical protein